MLAEHWSTQGMPGGCQDEMEPLQSQLGEAQKGLAARANCEENFHDAREAPLLHPASLKLFTLNLFLMETTVQHLLRQHMHTEGPMPQQRPPKPAWAKAAFFLGTSEYDCNQIREQACHKKQPACWTFCSGSELL